VQEERIGCPSWGQVVGSRDNLARLIRASPVMRTLPARVSPTSSAPAQVLEIAPDHPEAWILLGNLHMQKEEWAPAQKKFERVLATVPGKWDAYCVLALANIFLKTAKADKEQKVALPEHRLRAAKTVPHPGAPFLNLSTSAPAHVHTETLLFGLVSECRRAGLGEWLELTRHIRHRS